MATAQITRRKPRRMYSVDERATILAALDANHGNMHETARQFGIQVSSLQRIRQDAERETERGKRVRALRLEKRGELRDVWTDIAWHYAQQGLDKVAEVSGRDAIWSAAVATDKVQLLSGLPTSIVGHLDSRLAQLPAEQLVQIERWLTEAAERQAITADAPVTVDALPTSPEAMTSCPQTP